MARPILAALLAAGPLLWAADQLRLMRHRSRRRLDVQGRAVFASLGFVVLTALLGIGASFGTPFTPGDEPARWLLAYAAAGVVGWFGSTLIGNSYKILPFLIWYHRYRIRLGREAVPLVNDLYSDTAATVVLAENAAVALLLVTAALTGNLDLLHVAGAGAALVGVAHALTLGHMFLPKHVRRPLASPSGGTVTP
jgi:hypothetical protein